MKKRITAILLVLCLCLSLAACGGNAASVSASSAAPKSAETAAASAAEPAEASAGEPAEASAEEPDAQTPDEEAQPEDEASAAEEAEAAEISDSGFVAYELPLTQEPVTFRIWTKFFDPSQSPYVQDLNETVFWQELENRTGIHIDWDATAVNGTEEVNLMAATGDMPFDGMVDVISKYSGGASRAYEDGFILDLAEYMDYCPNYAHILESDDYYNKSVVTEDGHIFTMAMFMAKDSAPSMGMLIREDWLDDLGLEKPQTISEYHDVLSAFKNDKGANAAMFLNNYGSLQADMFGSAFGVASTLSDRGTSGRLLFQVDGEMKFSPFEDGYKDYLQLMHDWYDEGLIWTDFLTATDQMVGDMGIIGSGDCGLATGFSAFSAIFSEVSGGTWGGAYNPVSDNHDPNHLLGGVTYVRNGISVMADCTDVELFMNWCDYLYSEEGQLLKNYGVEGETLSYDADGNPVLDYAKLINNPDFDNSNITLTYYLGAENLWSLNNETIRYPGYDEATMSCLTCWAENSDIEHVVPFDQISFTAEEDEEFSGYWADIQTYLMQCIPAFITGSMSLDEYDTFVENLHAMDADRCLEIYQASLDRYNSK